MVKIRTVYLKITHCSFVLLFALVYIDPNYVRVIANKSLNILKLF